jgi:hypothetical protein
MLLQTGRVQVRRVIFGHVNKHLLGRGKGVQHKAALPPEADIAEFLHRMRPFVLEDERTSFKRVRGILWQRLNKPLFLKRLAHLQELFSVCDLGFTITVGDIALTAPAAVKKWLNAFEYHRDAGKQAELRAMYEVFPDECACSLPDGYVRAGSRCRTSWCNRG